MIIFCPSLCSFQCNDGKFNHFTYVPMGPLPLCDSKFPSVWVQVPLRYRTWMYCSGVHLNPNNMFHTIEWQSEATVDVPSPPFSRMRFEWKALDILYNPTVSTYRFGICHHRFWTFEDKTFTWMNFPVMVNLSIIHVVGNNHHSIKRYWRCSLKDLQKGAVWRTFIRVSFEGDLLWNFGLISTCTKTQTCDFHVSFALQKITLNGYTLWT